MFSVSAMILWEVCGVVSPGVAVDVSLLRLRDVELLICCVSAT